MTAHSFNALASILHVRSAALGELTPAVANHLWQSTAFAAAAALLTLALRKNTARVRHGIWMAASIKFLLPLALLSGLAAHFVRPKTVAVPRSVVVYTAVEDFSEPFLELVPTPTSAPAVVAPKINFSDWLPLATSVVWLTGVLTLLAVWTVRWRRIARTVRGAELMTEGREVSTLRALEAAGDFRAPLRIALCEDSMEPGVFGIANPVLAWPAGISERLSDAQLEAVLEHELCHVRRHDNLTAALHMLVEALLWFHPMVWWLGARLTAERERACDERVLEVCGRPAAYAESILKVCAFSIESPLECISGITGADLKQRVVEIMSARIALRLTFAKKLLLAVAAVCVLVVPFVLGQAQAARRIAAMMMIKPPQLLPAFLNAPAAPAASTVDSAAPAPQTITGTVDITGDTSGPAFEVASIRPYVPGPTTMRWQPMRDGFIEQGMPLKLLIANVYDVPLEYISGGPDWISSQAFDINAKLGEKETANFATLSPKQQDARFKAMLRTLLAERFKLRLQRATKDLPVYALVVSKGGSKLVESPPLVPNAEGVMPPDGSSMAGFGDGRLKYKRTSMRDFAANLSRNPDLARQVNDETGLAGRYDFEYKWTTSQDGPSLFTALEDQLGLKLEPRKAPIATLVIVSAEKPTVDGAEVDDSTAAKLVPAALVQDKAVATPAADAEYVPTMTFDVASVRQAKVDLQQGITVSGGFEPQNSCHLRFNNFDLWNLVSSAYPVDRAMMDGFQKLPEETRRAFFNIEAKCDPADEARLAKLDKLHIQAEHAHMMRVLLEERFNLKAHWETRDGKTYDLVVSKPGRLHTGSGVPSAEELAAWGDHEMPPLYQHGSSETFFTYTAHGATTDDIAGMLTNQFGRPVNDKTGLTGKYDFDMKTHDTWNSDRRKRDTSLYPTLEDAIEDQLGLKIVPSTGPVKFLVIDHMDMPTEN